jgi:hypothetical protein
MVRKIMNAIEFSWVTAGEMQSETGTGAHPASCDIGIRDLYPELIPLGHEADHTPQSNTDVKNDSSYDPTTRYVFMVWQMYVY